VSSGSTCGTTTPPTDNVLENGVTVSGISGAAKEQIFYTLAVPSGATGLGFVTTGSSGDADLYVKFGSNPSLTDYDCKSTSSSSNESCDIASAQTGTYHVMVEAWNAIDGATLTGSFTEDGGTNPGDPTPIDNTFSDISVGSGAWAHYTQVLVDGYSTLTVTISGGSGDADLYVTHGSASTTSNYDCRPYKYGNDEVCTVTSPTAGTWYVDIRGYNASSGVTLNIKAD